ncbi:MAG: Bacillopeptidase, partial [Chloroflexi bacterium]|nr:Bacillopeptidase [Chloroflexota bacterium]
SQVFADFKDFSGAGPNFRTAGGEAFLDASSIGAQGRTLYDVTKPVSSASPDGAGVWVSPDYPTPSTPCKIRVLGMAPGASLYGFKINGINGPVQVPYASSIVQAIQYAVQVDHVDVLSESLGIGAYPDNASNPISLANDAAVAAGVTVVASSGDGGNMGRLITPASDQNVITVGATTQFRSYQQLNLNGFEFGKGGYVSNNISALSSSGPSQSANRNVDVVAGGDKGWALCSPDVHMYAACTDNLNRPSRLQLANGTSESAPLVAGEAALVIQAYRSTHGGTTPSPELVRRIIMSTATDLGNTGNEQGAGLIDSYRAVRAALSIQDGAGHPAPQGDSILVNPGTPSGSLSATGIPNAPETFRVQVTNVGASSQNVRLSANVMEKPFNHTAFALTLSPSTAPTSHVLGYGLSAYVQQAFTVPAGSQRLDAAIAFDTLKNPSGYVALVLIDPAGRFAAYSNPEGIGSGYGHVDVSLPRPGVWKAFIFTPKVQANLPEHILSYSGTVHLDVALSRFTTVLDAGTSVLQPGQTASIPITLHTPAVPGDVTEKVLVTSQGVGSTAPANVVAIPVTLRTLIPIEPVAGATFGGMLTGGNGRFPGTNEAAQVFPYQFDVPPGKHDLALSLAIRDNHYNLEGILVDPRGQQLNMQGTVTGIDPVTGNPTKLTNALQFYQSDPAAGRWEFMLILVRNIPGQQTTLPFRAKISFNSVNVRAPNLPNDAHVTLQSHATLKVPVKVTNTGNTTKAFFVDPRLNKFTTFRYAPFNLTIPLTATEHSPVFYVPPQTTDFSVGAMALAPTVPISLEIFNANGVVGGAPGQTAGASLASSSPYVEGTPFRDTKTGNYAAQATVSAPEVAPGLWVAEVGQVGPYNDRGAALTSGNVFATIRVAQFDPAIGSDTGDYYTYHLGLAQAYSPLVLDPGQSGTIHLAITPNAAPGTLVAGRLYVDTISTSLIPGQGQFAVTGSGDELVALPYTYTVGAGP